MNAVTQKDFYKTDHRRQYPEDTSVVYSNFTPRSSRLANMLPKYFDEKIVWFGLQVFIKDFLIKEWNESFFNIPKEQAVGRYKRRLDTSLGMDAVPTDHIEALHDLGYLPIRIKSLPEGTRVDIRVPPFTVINTHPDFFWLTNDLETVMSCDLWKPSTTATIAFEYKKIMTYWAKLTGAPLENIQFQCHDFSFRGMSGRKDAAISGMGHLLSFVGTDTIPAIDAAEDYYNADPVNELIGTSVPATEHSVMCMGTKDDEIGTFRRLITELYPTGIVSIVSDTWDFWKVVTEYIPTLKDEILARAPNALGLNKVVLRPDSGDPELIICGLVEGEHYVRDADGCGYFEDSEGNAVHIPEHVIKGAVECLWETFGGTMTGKGYKVLDEHIGLIYGDSITLQRAETILSRLEQKGFASNNIVFGVGSYTYQYVTRDTFGWAMKATFGVVDGEFRDIQKDPATDSGDKKSACGMLRVDKVGNNYILTDQISVADEMGGRLKTVFKDGELIIETSLSEIREQLTLD
jgi:nicotinamide phosphoribosyltransferase